MTAAGLEEDKPQPDFRLLTLPRELRRQTNRRLQDPVLDWLLREASVSVPVKVRKLVMWNKLPVKVRTWALERFRKAHAEVYRDYAEVLFLLSPSRRRLRVASEVEAAMAAVGGVREADQLSDWGPVADVVELLDRVTSKVAQDDLPAELAEVRTAEDFMVAVRSLHDRSGLSVRRIEKSMKDNAGKAARSKSTIDGILRSSTMPRDPHVLQALLTALVTATDEPSSLVDRYMKVRNNLVQQAKPVPDPAPEPVTTDDVDAEPDDVVAGAPALAEAGIEQAVEPARRTWIQRIPPQLSLVVFTVGVLALLAALVLVG